MGGVVKTGVVVHDNACLAAEVTRQNAVIGVPSSPAGQVTVNNAEIAWARACLASCKANNNSVGQEAFVSLLKALGTGGV